MDGSVVLDTSVVVKWYRQGEILAAPALKLRAAYLDGQTAVFVPALLAYELAKVLRYKTDLTAGQVQDAIRSLFDMGLEWVLPTSAAMRRAAEIAYACETTIYDAAFVALAESLSAIYITADERLARRLEAYPFVRFLGHVAV
jgi:predicted nucleic acid-binding protein